jgi:transposase
VQIADRFHLVKNAGEALERVLQQHHPELRRAAKAVDQAMSAEAAPTVSAEAEPAALQPLPATMAYSDPSDSRPAPTQAPAPPSRAQQAKAASRDRRLARYDAVLALHRQGVPLRAIARHLGLGRPTVRRFVQADGFPERAERVTRPTSLTPYEPYLRERWTAGCQNARQLYDEIHAQGYRGSVSLVRHVVAAWRPAPGRPGRPARQVTPAAGPTPPVRPPTRVLSARQAHWLLVTPAADLAPEQRVYLTALRQACPAIVTADQLTREFGRVLRDRDAAGLAPWLTAALASGLPEFGELARGIERDRAAVEAALRSEWSNGQTEAQVLQLKVVRRQMRGRGRFELVRRRVVHDGPVSPPRPRRKEQEAA